MIRDKMEQSVIGIVDGLRAENKRLQLELEHVATELEEIQDMGMVSLENGKSFYEAMKESDERHSRIKALIHRARTALKGDNS